MSEIKVRFAPSPTGTLHVGGIRTALFDFFFAKSQGGKFMLRIEDTDQARKVEGAVETIKESLLWLGANWDEYVVQSGRLDVYKKYANELLEKGLARKEENGAIRFLVPKEGSTSWVDAVGNKTIEFQNKEIEDFVILKADAFPTYHLANVIDDHEMNITHVIRGEEWISSGPKHILIYKAFGWTPPVFAHVPNVLGTDGKKLSKRRGAKSSLDYKKDGYLADALLNYLMLLGWSPKNDQEILTREEIEKEFKLENIHTSPAVFDERKLLWMNGEYIRMASVEELKEKLLEFDPTIQEIDSFEKYIPLAQTRMKTLAEFRDLSQNDQEVVLSPEQKALANVLLDKLNVLEDWNSEALSQICLSARDELGLKTKDIFTVLTGKPQGLPFQEKLFIEGKEKSLTWLKKVSS